MHKSRSKLNYALICIVSLAIIGSGFVRDSIFRTINWQINHFQTDNPVLVRSSFYHKLFIHFSTYELYATKWLLTIIFSILFFGSAGYFLASAPGSFPPQPLRKMDDINKKKVNLIVISEGILNLFANCLIYTIYLINS